MSDETATIPSSNNVFDAPVGTEMPDVSPISDVPVEDMTASEKRKYKLLIDGAEEEVDEDEVVKRAQKASAADKKFQESAQLRKQAEQLLVMLKNDPFSVLTQLGLDPTEIAREHLTRELQTMRMSPEERELAELRAEKESRLSKEKEEAERKAAEQEEMIRAEMAGRMEKEIIGALESVKLPRDESSVKAMVEIMKYALSGDVEITWEEAAMIVKDNHKKNYSTLFSQLGEDELVEFLGEDVVKKLVKRSTKKLYNQEPPREQPKLTSNNNRRNSVWDD